MLEKDVPQDEGMAEGLKDVCYAVNTKGKYVLVPSAGWEAKQIANDQAWDLINDQVETVCGQIRAGEKSILAYHMSKNLMDITLLAQYVGFSRFRVWWHLRPAPFARLTNTTLQKYAQVFGITIQDLLDMSFLDKELETKKAQKSS